MVDPIPNASRRRSSTSGAARSGERSRSGEPSRSGEIRRPAIPSPHRSLASENTSSSLEFSLVQAEESRRYRVIGVLGQGGFGTVYHARLEGADGFVKEVAIKLLTAEEPSAETLSRFRDEAKILGRLRSRGIVSVDPPCRLGGRWAVVMEYVDGLDCRRLLREHGSLPPTVAVEIVAEVARTLHDLWEHPGEDGRPLRLLHRDLKPGNIQITPTGEVKLLDFGVAKADFGEREWNTTDRIAGTLGYIAPERVRGIEAPAGDIYSLGIVLEQMVTGYKPSEDEPEEFVGWEGIPDEIIELAHQMRSPAPSDRPSAEEVGLRCAMLSKEPGISLREWARANVRPHPTPRTDDPLVGQTLTETFARSAARPSPARRLAPALLVGLAVPALLGAVLIASAGAIGLGWWYMQRPASLASTEPPALSEPPPRPAAVAAEPARPEPAAPTPALPAPTTVARPPPAPAPPALPAPAQPAPRPATPEPSGASPTPVDPPAPAAPKPTTGVISQEGADAIELAGEPGLFGVGMVPVGTYSVQARFGRDFVPIGDITVAPGERVSLRCDPEARQCTKR